MTKLIALFVGFLAFSGACAQGIPVYDNATFLQSVMQVANTVKQLQTMSQQLQNMQQHLDAIKGNRGMENVLSNQNRQYLPGEWAQVGSMLNQSQSQYGEIASAIQAKMGQNAVLSEQDLNKLSPQQRDFVMRARQAAATQSALSTAAYNNASANVSRLQQLTNAISSASDPKAIADLQARIQVEQTMLQNDATKLAQAAQVQEAEERVLNQQLKELAIGLGGSLESSPVKLRVNR